MAAGERHNAVEMVPATPGQLAALTAHVGDMGAGRELVGAVFVFARAGGQAPTDAAEQKIHRIGRLEYRAGFKDVWAGDEYFNLRGRTQARLCVEYLATMRAVDAASARHFATEIDPYVREKGGLGQRGKFSEIQLKQYFNDRKARLPKLRKELIGSVVGTGKYYLKT